eukprot:TRINITY_DN64241_c0_g1_i1.p1 TRINITY_DN64241_c0_g1~~TRINITY_DN64241_c0_g1_i1.p1  ORF type:complete len:390 (+),score=38.11 TRINITY_DN64241_c0_g1_i1:26-1195(+)
MEPPAKKQKLEDVGGGGVWWEKLPSVVPLIQSVQPSTALAGKKDKKKPAQTPAKWEVKPVPISSVRKDKLETVKWVKQGAPIDDKHACFSKDSGPNRVWQYTNDEYLKWLQDVTGKWTKPATDTLFALCKQFALKWPVILDRWPGGTHYTIEDMKERYYYCAGRLAASKCSSEAEKIRTAALWRYNADEGRRRRVQMQVLWDRTAEEQEAEEKKRSMTVAIQRLKNQCRIKAGKSIPALKRTRADDDELRRIPPPPTRVQRKPKAGVMLRSTQLLQPQTTGSSAAAGVQKEVDAFIEKLNVSMPTTRITALVHEIKDLVATFHDTQRQAVKKEKEILLLNAKKADLQKKIQAKANGTPIPVQAPPPQHHQLQTRSSTKTRQAKKLRVAP